MRRELIAVVVALGSAQAAERHGTRGLFVIDPGHGGTNLGAPSLAAGVFEKNITLDIARRLRMEIGNIAPATRVMLTRDDDRYLTLRSRTRVANQSRADVLVSVHLNASTDGGLQGFETYTYGAGPLLEGTEKAPGVAGAILADLRRRGLALHNSRLATAIEGALTAVRGRQRNRGQRRASFDVLREAEMPAVLIEVGYLDHRTEGQEMLEPAKRQEIAVAIARALIRFRGQRTSTDAMYRFASR